MSNVNGQEYAAQLGADLGAISSEAVRERFFDLESRTPEYDAARSDLMEQLAGNLGQLVLQKNSTSDVVAEESTSKEESVNDAIARLSAKEKITPEAEEAQKIIDELIAIQDTPITETKASKIRAARERKNRRTHEQAKRVVPTIIHNPLMHKAAMEYLEKLRIERREDVGAGKTGKVVEAVMLSQAEYIQENWKDIPPEVLAGYVRLIAETSQDDSNESLYYEGVLAQYFSAPKQPAQRVDALYAFTEGVFTLIDDVKSLEVGTTIANFGNPNVLPAQSEYFADVVMCNTLEWSVLDEESFKKAYTLSDVVSTLQDIVLRVPAPLSPYVDWRRRLSRSAYSRARQADTDRKAREIVGQSKLKELLAQADNMANYIRENLARTEDFPPAPEIDSKLFDLIFSADAQLSLHTLYKAAFGALADTKLLGKKHEGDGGYKTDGFISITTPSGQVVDIFTPDNTTEGQREALVEEALVEFKTQEADCIDRLRASRGVLSVMRSVYESTSFSFSSQVTGLDIKGVVRDRVQFDDVINHPLSDFAYSGFNFVVRPKDGESRSALQVINDEANRFVSRRGIRFNIPDKIADQTGLTQATFYGRGPRTIGVSLVINGRTREFELQDYLPFDEANPAIVSSGAAADRSLKYLHLLLSEWMTRPAVETSEGKVEEGHRNPSGVGFFRYLPLKADGSKQKRSDTQWDLCVEEQGRDLDEDSRRRAPLDPTGQQRNSTYVGERDTDSVNKQPLTVYL